MKAIINGKTYNTETSEVIVAVVRKLYTSWDHLHALFRTKNGAYFIQEGNDHLWPVDEKGDMDLDPEENLITNIHDWLDHWHIKELPPREMEYFGITEA